MPHRTPNTHRRAAVALAGALLAAAHLTSTATAQGILPPPPVPPGNPLTVAKALLGKALFWDEQLSSQRTVACGTCHRFAEGGSDPRSIEAVHPGADGLFGTADDVHGSPGVVRHDAAGAFVADAAFGIRPQVTRRKAQSPINAAYGVELFWDGRASDVFHDPVTGAVVLPTGGALESQIAEPPISDVEMGHLGRSWTDIAADIAPLRPLALADQLPPALQAFVQGQTYAALFQQVFGSPGVTPVRIVFAIASYERTLISDQSPLDLALVGQGSLSPAAAAGQFEFQGLCATCHTDLSPSVLASGPVLHDFRNIGVRPFPEDPGRFRVTGQILDSGKFKVPGLRNVALRAPYFHDGSAATLQDVLAFYARGGDFHVNQDVLVASMPGQISTQDRQSLAAFLDALTDPRVVQGLPPFDRPRLWSEGARVPTVFGAGTPGTAGGAPAMIALTPPYRGNPAWTLGLADAVPGQPAFLCFDTVGLVQPQQVLGLDVHLGLTGALTAVGAAVTAGNAPRGGVTSLSLPIPFDPALPGLPLFAQWLVGDPLGPFGASASDATAFAVF
ncbi:MAG: cytochrome-c peroxidase [Planctomycetota bacterium]